MIAFIILAHASNLAANLHTHVVYFCQFIKFSHNMDNITMAVLNISGQMNGTNHNLIGC